MKQTSVLWVILVAMIASLAIGQTTIYLGAQSATPYLPVQSSDFLAAWRGSQSSPTTQVGFSPTVQQVLSAITADLIQSGNNTQMVLNCTQSCDIFGNVSANECNGVAFPVNAPLLATNAAQQCIAITPTSTGCIGVSNDQIYWQCPAGSASTLSSELPCNSTNALDYAMQTDVSTFPPTRGGAMSGGGSSEWTVQCLDDAGTYQWTYL